ncbi:MAG: cellulase family glycosylhydrolase [Colwellia sp.]
MKLLKFNYLLVLSLIITSSLLGCSKQEEQLSTTPTASIENTASAFVSVKNGKFNLNNKAYYFAGTNFWHAAYLGMESIPNSNTANREKLIKELDNLKSLGITNLRVLAASESSDLMMALRPAMQTKIGQYDDRFLQGLDFLLSEMNKRDMKAVLFLNNFWQWSGGMSQYVSWLTGEPVFDPDVTGDWNGFMENSAKFYRMPKAQEYYRQLIKKVISRTNSINGIAYVDDPTIMTWELANEPRPGSDQDGGKHAQEFLTWVDNSAKYIHSLDKNHLVTTGSEGSMGTVRDADLFVKTHQLASIDYATFHLWPKNWQWFDVKNPEATFDSAMKEVNAYIDLHFTMAKTINKPMVMEEFGVERDQGSFSPEATTVWRDKILGKMFDRVNHHAVNDGNVGGTNFWAWSGSARTDRSDYIWQDGDEFFGDPPQEPQGLNAVFDSDTSTLVVIKKHASEMNTLSK